MRIVDSRRLRGPNLASRAPGAIAEVALEPGESASAAEAAWRKALATMARGLGLPELSARAIVRPFAGGLALMIPAPIDALLAATDLDDWAIEAASAHLKKRRLKESARSARSRLARAFREESSPSLVAIEAEAKRRAVPFFWDDELVTLGHAARSQSFELDHLPPPGEVDWGALSAIPVALVTGTNGKTTTTRLVGRIAKLAGLVPGASSSDGVTVDERTIEAGDWTGAEAARMVLRHEAVELAVLETARGGILRRGLAIDRCDAAIVTNVSDDHFGEYGVHDLATMARVKAVVGRAVRPGGRFVVNADDPELVRVASEMEAEIVLFSLDAESEIVGAHLARGGHAFVSDGVELAHMAGRVRDVLARVDEVPLTFGGAARHNVANVLGAAALARALDLPRDAIVTALRTFGAKAGDNPGRGTVIELEGGVRALLDFGHNPAGLRELYGLARTLVAPGAAILAVTVQGGDRSEADFSALAREIVHGGASRAVVWESARLMRGRANGEVRALLRRGLVSHGLREEAVGEAEDEAAAIASALEHARGGDLIVVAPHLTRGDLGALFRGRARELC